MYILVSFDWNGPLEELEDRDKKLKNFYDGKEGVEFLGRYAPHNKTLHWTRFFWAKDFNTWINRKTAEWMSKRDYKVMTHQVAEYYT